MRKYQIHQSALGLIARCGIAYEFRYERGIKLPPRAYQAVGTGVDRAVRSNLAAKIEGGELLPLEQVRDIARDNAVVALDGFEPDSKDLEEFGTRERTHAAAVDRAVRLSGLHAKELAPQLEPSDVAAPFVLDIEGLEDYQFVGEVDVKERTGAIRDTKTKKKSPSQGEAAVSMQLTAYAMAEYATTSKIPEALYLDSLVDLKRGPEVRTQATTRKLGDFTMLLNRILAFVTARKLGSYQPAPPDGPTAWQCSRDYCGYWDMCPYSARPMTLAVSAPRNVVTEIAPLQERIQRGREADDE